MLLNKSYIPQDTVRRLSLYLRSLKILKQDKINVVSSKDIAKFLNISSVQFRKDLSYFGEFGKRGVGYDALALSRNIEKILGTDVLHEIILVGVGRLGSALLEYSGFLEFKLKICAAFDNDKHKIGRKYGRIKIKDIGGIRQIIKLKKIKIAILSVPAEAAQKVSAELINAGIKAILNFSSVNLRVSRNIFVTNVDMASELEGLIFKLKKGNI